MNRARLVLLVGLPGSGKSTWLAEQKIPGISSDQIRFLLSDSEETQTIHRLVFATMRYLVRQRLRAGALVTCIDATSIALWERRSWIRFAALHDCEIEAVFFDVPIPVCLERNRLRSRVVPEEVILSMSRRIVPPTVEEGFSRITVIS